MTTVAVSGYFTILHKGHMNLFNEAKKLGDKLTVIVNNNQQQIAKKGKLIHDADDIKHIIEHFHMVDNVVVSVDKDGSQCATLEMLKPDIFANGGDRNQGNIPEVAICEKHGIEMVDNVGGEAPGEKTDSSSRLIETVGL